MRLTMPGVENMLLYHTEDRNLPDRKALYREDNEENDFIPHGISGNTAAGYLLGPQKC